MEKQKLSAELYRSRLRVILLIAGGVTALRIALETLIGALSFLGVSHPENALHAVKTYIFGATDYKIVAFILAALTVFLCARYMRTQGGSAPARYLLLTLSVREITAAVGELGHLALKLLGLDGGVNTLVSQGGYLIRMADPLLGVICGATVTIFSIAYLCVFFASVGDGIRSEDQSED